MVLRLASLVLLVCVGADTIRWDTCPEDSSTANDCAFVPVPLSPEQPGQGNITVFVRRFYSLPSPPDKAIWMVEGGPGFDGQAFEAPARMLSQELGLTVYVPDQRGTGRSSLVTCKDQPGFFFDPSDSTALKKIAVCITEILEQHAQELPFFTSHNSAVDMRDILKMISPTKLSIYALSYGTYLTNQYLQLPGARADAVILDGPVPPDRWVLSTNSLWSSSVAQTLLSLCARESKSCRRALADDGSIAMLTMDSVIDGTLPCLAHLPPSFTALKAAYVSASLVQNQTKHVLLGPFWHRLKRCSSSDVTQLRTFLAASASEVSEHPARTWGGDRPAAYSFGLATNIGASELYSFTNITKAATYSEQVFVSSRLFAPSGASMSVEYSRTKGWPLYNPNPATFRRFAQPDIPVIILSGTLDPNTPHGLGTWFQMGLGPNATLVTVPYAAHGTVNPDAPCVLALAAEFLGSFGKSLNTSCLNTIPVPDFEGDRPETAALSMHYFDTTALWND